MICCQSTQKGCHLNLQICIKSQVNITNIAIKSSAICGFLTKGHENTKATKNHRLEVIQFIQLPLGKTPPDVNKVCRL